MQIGIDVGATKIESVVLEDDGNEKYRSRTSCPKDYLSIIRIIKDIHQKLEKEFQKEKTTLCLSNINYNSLQKLFLSNDKPVISILFEFKQIFCGQE